MKKILSILLALVMLVSFCACGQSVTEPQKTTEQVTSTPEVTSNTPENTEPIVITDALGRRVELPAVANKIIALSNVPRMVVYLGLADRVVGYSGSDPASITPLTAYSYAVRDLWADVPIVGTDAGGNTDYYPEEIIAAKPDVIICSYTEDVVKNLETQTGIPVVSVAMGNLFEEDYNQSLLTIAQICGVEDRAEEIIAYIDACLADLDKRTASIADSDKPAALSAAATFKGAHGIEGVRIKDQVFTAVNAVNVAVQDTPGDNSTAVEVDKEQILAWNADYIFCDYGGVQLVKQDAKASPDFYAQLKAYNDGHIYQYPSSTSYYSNLEIPLANCYFVGSILYPEQFADVDLNTKANEIFKFFLGVDDFMSVLNEYGASYGPIDFGNNE
ncbi:iron complex transport system substrate-binding protein [Ruminiclostridium sufflavum DSM 19573]|uniref:Iron complex transport system substrate-binding protein n=1 Tax=Ruminiclostridium sufflavum DSM 19573 TaxID=1121337 RepID=A0A318XHK2_9FIRM|nr:ABC transporter substrate-binding protein [Ruminiclostridium sufflavum]PYG84341.1 iron complex transport system substrate-binding protein [Ruminiclostridium sufflavum DSM 19573]